MRSNEFEMIFCVVNSGFSETVMEAAKDAGARGGTVMRGHGTANREAEDAFGITIQSDKEIIMIIVPKEIKDAVLTAVYRTAGMNSPGKGIAFSLPVDHVAGISGRERDAEIKPEDG